MWRVGAGENVILVFCLFAGRARSLVEAAVDAVAGVIAAEDALVVVDVAASSSLAGGSANDALVYAALKHPDLVK